MFPVKYSTIFLCSALATYALISKILFDNIYKTANLVIDEQFHFQLGEAYCKFEFDKWHPKVTTFPGLYLLSSLLLGPFELCTTYWLRLTSLFCSFVNIILFCCLLNINNEQPLWQNVVSALNMALLPPLYFFSHLYYTDVASLTMILALFLLSQKGHHYFASIFGMCAILFRQTNIVWVAMAFGCYVLSELSLISQKKSRRAINYVSSQELRKVLKMLYKNLWVTTKKTSLYFWLNATSYGTLILVFVLFVLINGSIVVGDKSAHEATIHFPQLFYFSLFCLFFAWPHFTQDILTFLKFVRCYKVLMSCILFISLVMVHYNTLVHPYVLADNRHYVFYVWNRFYGKYSWFRYIVIPLYIYAWFVIIRRLWCKRDVTFLLFFIPCATVVLITQKLLEFRYFFIPYVLFRIHLKNVSFRSVILEFLTNVVLNICTLYLFFTKTIEWDDFECPQRLIW